MAIARGMGWDEMEEGKGRHMVVERDLTSGGECTMKCENDVL